MKNNIRIFCLFSICLGISACSNEYTHDNFKNFEELCEFSGGSYQKKVQTDDPNHGICKCGNVECSDGVVCSNGRCAYECEDKSFKCDGNNLMICKDKRWDIKAKCDRCDDDDVLCTQHGENCQEEYTVCEDGNILRKCEDNIIKIQPCQFKASCVDGNNCNECGENATNCKDEKTLQSCVDNHWKETSCANGCDVENDKCKPEESQPSCQTGDEEQKECKPICTNNTECPDGQVCKDNDCVSKDDNDECSTDSCPNGQCENGECRVKNSNSCQNNNECPFNICEGNQCVECRKDTARCYNRFVEKCVDGKWKKMNPKPSVKHVKAVLNVLMTTKVVFNMSVMKMAFGI